LKQKEICEATLDLVSKQLIDSFFQEYGPALDKWDGEVSIFEDFDPIAEKIISQGNIDRCSELLSDVESNIIDHLKYDGLITDEEKLCRICLMEILDGIEDHRICVNGHPVHEDCYNEWATHSLDCPLCKGTYPKGMINDLNGSSLI